MKRVFRPLRLEAGGVSVFQERTVPAGSRLAGWSLLCHALRIAAPVRAPACVAELHIRGSSRREGEWHVFDKRYWPGDTFADHLSFALRHEEIDLLVLKRIFEAVPRREIEAFVRVTPTGIAPRRAWYLYEAMTGRTLDLEDAPNAPPADLLDPAAYFTGKPRTSKRHRIRDNLTGTARFCPIIRRTDLLSSYIAQNLSAKAKETVGRTGAHLVARAASFLLLADSRASFEIEGERPPRGRLERWGRAVMQAGKHPLSLDEMVRLHGVLIEDTRFTKSGLRLDGVFVGERDHNGDPLPEFVGAVPEDLSGLMAGLLEANERMREDGLDPVLEATATAFGFVYIHPFQDGNGRMHRCLIHHVLVDRKFTPPGMVFPVSSVMLDRIDEYREALQGHSGPLMPFIEWRATPDRNVEVLNPTGDLYRYYDCTAEAEFLYSCVRRTVVEDVPREIDYLRRHDEAIHRIMDAIEMPDRIAENLVLYIRKNHGVLGKKRRKGEFKMLRDDEVALVEGVVRDVFQD